MTKLFRIPRLLLPALCLAACTADEPAAFTADGQALVIKDLRIAGTDTRTAQPIVGGFMEGSTLQATIAYDGQTSTGLYTYNNNVWTSDAPAYWFSGTQPQTVTLSTSTPNPVMPEAFTADNWHQYDILTYNGQTIPTTSFTLNHTRAQLCVTLTAGAGLTDTDLANATVKIADSSTLWYINGAYYALLDPATYTALPTLTITLNDETYTYTPETSTTPVAGQCLMLVLTLSKTGVSNLSTSCEGWQEVTVTGTEDTDGVINNTAGGLGTALQDKTLSGKVYIMGTINNDDLTALIDKLGNVTHLYILAESGTEKLTVPNNFFAYTIDSPQLQAVVILHATDIEEDAFSSCNKLTSIELPKAKTIGTKAFSFCSSLTSIALPNAQSIGDNAFSFCSSLTSIALPNAQSIGDNAFNSCNNLTSIELPNAQSIGNEAFYGCSNLTSIELPNAQSIGNEAFYGCSNLTSIELPSTTTMSDNAFSFCNSLTTLFFTNADATKTDAQEAVENNLGGHTGWQTVYYGYKGSGDYLDPANYEHTYSNN